MVTVVCIALVTGGEGALEDKGVGWLATAAKVPEFLGGRGETFQEALVAVARFFETAIAIAQGTPTPSLQGVRKRVDVIEEGTDEAKGDGGGGAKSFGVRQTSQTGCEPGVVIWAMALRDTCNTGIVCTVLEAWCNGTLASLDMHAADFRSAGTSCTVTQLVCNGITVDLEEQHGATNCRAVDTFCTASTPIGLCSVQVECDPGHAAYGQNAYGYSCTTDQLVCDGAVRAEPRVYDNQTLPDGCEVQRTEKCANMTGTCHSITCSNETEPCTLHVTSAPC
jgi:hypothetical protein